MNASWSPYRPDTEAPWTLQRVVHLHRRAGFAATWSEVQRDLREGVDASIQRLLSGQAYMSGVPDDFDVMSEAIAKAAVASNNPNRLKAWWLYRMLFSPDPLTERLTLMWHNHFATSNLKVANMQAMQRQNQGLRTNAQGTFAELLTQVVKDSAILIWLDADSNRKQHPNENLARELMELFSVGVGNYDEQDVKEGARALTGWTSKQGRFRFVTAYHDDGEKRFLGNRGKFAGDDVLRILLEHPATARRIAGRLCEQFFGEGAIGEESIDELAVQMRAHDLDIGWAVETILRSEAFFATENMGNRVLGPAEYVVGAVRALEMFDPPPSTLVLSEWCARLGQDLFYPPNVFGWPGGREWITTRSMIGRAAFATQIVNGSIRRPAAPPATARLREHVKGNRASDRMLQLATTLLVTSCSPECLKQFRAATPEHAGDLQILQSVLASPQAQLG